MKKPVIKSPLDRLPQSVRHTIIQWLTTEGKDGRGLSYEEVRTRLRKHHGVTASVGALHGFYHRNAKPPAPAANPTPVVNADGGITITVNVTIPRELLLRIKAD